MMISRSGMAVRLALVAFCAAASARSATAQETINHASVSGRVTDTSGGVVAGAQVTARQTDTNLTGEATTDGDGRFRFPYLKVGPYEIVVRQSGFADATRQLTLTVGAAFQLPVQLTVAAIEAGVTATRDARGIEAAPPPIPGTISQTEGKNPPAERRHFLHLAPLLPGG